MRTVCYLAAGLLLWTAAESVAEKPHLGYGYPAGGRQDSVFEMEIGGQYLEEAADVLVTGQGVRAEVLAFGVRYETRQLNSLHRNLNNNRQRLEEERETLDEKELTRLTSTIARLEKQIRQTYLPEGIDPFDVKKVRSVYRSNEKEQFNPQISDRLRVRVTIDPQAPPGRRELRVRTPAGISNAIFFEVGVLNEVRETEPNDDHMSPDLQVVSIPAVINGQIRPGDIDHFRFKAARGDSIVVDVGARRIIPYLADAVPGWFQAVVALYDEDGNEVAYQDDYKFNPDPVLFFDVPDSGVYTLSIRDSIYRGREDFIYRIAVGELPFITGIFPLGGQRGTDVDIALSGRNLPKSRISGRLPADAPPLRHVSVMQADYRSNLMPFAAGSEPECFEHEPNDAPDQAQSVDIPIVINGRIQQPGDRDGFVFSGTEGESVSIEVTARRLNSPLDSVITLSGPGLPRPVRNDDYVSKDSTQLYLGDGLVTHHADSYLVHKLPATGLYRVEIGDTQAKGGHDYGYRLHIRRSTPGFELRMEPSGVDIAPNATAAFTIRVTRKEGFDGDIVLDGSGLPEGFRLGNPLIPAQVEFARFTLTAPARISQGLLSPEIRGIGMIDGRAVTNRVMAVDDQMQAFLYRHLVPAEELTLAPVDQRPPVAFEVVLPKSGVIELPLGQEVAVDFTGRIFGKGRGVQLRLDAPPEGLTLSGKGGWLGLRAIKASERDAFSGNVFPASGRIVLKAGEPLKVGDRLSIVVAGELSKGRRKDIYPSPAFPVVIVGPEPVPQEPVPTDP